jgi:hypothetical protein
METTHWTAEEVVELQVTLHAPACRVVNIYASAATGAVAGFTAACIGCPTVEKVVLSMLKGVGVEGWKAVAEAVQANSAALADLAVSSCNKAGLSGKGMQHLAAALQQNTAITRLKLWQNGLTDADAQQLAEMLAVNTTIVRLVLGGNRGITTEGQAAVQAAWGDRPTVALLL